MSGGNERSLTIDVPAGATQLRVDTTGTIQSGLPDVTVLVKDEAGNILGTHTWALKDRTTDTLTVDVGGQSRLLVVARAIDGDASLDVRVTAIVPGQPEVIVVHQTIVITQTVTTTTTTMPSPTSTTPTPTPTPTTPAPSPTPTPPTNATNNSTSNASV